jgi:hypothetical protein
VYDPKASRQHKPTTLASPKSTPPKVTIMLDAVALHDRIRERAYELYESRGRENGKEEQDWFRAEHEVRTQPR